MTGIGEMTEIRGMGMRMEREEMDVMFLRGGCAVWGTAREDGQAGVRQES